MSRHRCCEDHVSEALRPENLASHSGTIIGPGKVNIHYTLPVFEKVVEPPSLGWNTGIGNHNMETTEVFDHAICCCLDLQ